MTYAPTRCPGTALTVVHAGRPRTSALRPSCSSQPASLSRHLPGSFTLRYMLDLYPGLTPKAAYFWWENIPSPPYPYQERGPRTPFFLNFIPTPPASVIGVTSVRAGRVCGSPHLHPTQRRFFFQRLPKEQPSGVLEARLRAERSSRVPKPGMGCKESNNLQLALQVGPSLCEPRDPSRRCWQYRTPAPVPRGPACSLVLSHLS